MPGKFIKNIFLLLSFLAVTCFSSSKLLAAHAPEQLATETFGDPSQQFPNGELERVQHPSSAGWNITAHKNLVSSALLQGTIVDEEQASFKSPVVKTSSLRVKDYLLHIHPYHHFW